MKLIYFILFTITLSNCSTDDFSNTSDTIENFTIHSNITNDDYPIYVLLPENYKNNTTNELIIALDGDTRFNTIANIISEKNQNGTIPPVILIAIGNNAERNRDYTPTVYKHGEGGADNYYEFITDELIPQLESRYTIDTSNNKTLIGHSFGGLFTQYALSKDRTSSPFNKFIASGTSYWFDSGVIFEYEQNYANTNDDLEVTFYNGMGTLEGGVMLASFEEMNERLDNRGFENFTHKNELIEESGHSGAVNTIFKKGLDYVFSN